MADYGNFGQLLPGKEDTKPAAHGYGAFQDLAPKEPFLERMATSVMGMVKGDATEDLPNVNEAGMTGFKEGMASMFGSDEDYANALARKGYQITQDENGNPIAVGPDGKRAYVNQPGLDMEDITRGAGKVLSFVPAAKAATAAPGLVMKALAGGSVAGATDVGMQVAAGREEVDPQQTMLATGAGVVGELGGSAIQKLANVIKMRRPPTAAEGREVLKVMGMDPNVSDEVAMAYAQQARMQVQANVRPEARVAEAEFGLKPDPSQQVDDYWRTRDIATEASPRVRSAQNEQIARAESEGQRVGQQIGGVTEGDPTTIAMQGVKDTAAARKEAVDAAYQGVDNMQGSVQGGAFDDLFSKINQFADENFLRGQHNAPVYPGSQSILGNMDALAQQVRQLRNTPGVQGFNAPFKAVEGFRRAINAAVGSAKSSDLAASKGLLKEFDGWVDDVFDRGLVDGSTDFLAAQKEARGLYTRYKKDFGERWLKKGSDAFGKKMESFLEGDTSIEQMADFVLGVGERIKPDTAREFARRMRSVLPKEKYDAFRQAAWERNMLNNYTGDNKGLRAISNNIKASLVGKNKRLFDEILTADERSLVKRYGMAIDSLIPGSPVQRRQAGSSQTAERLIGALLSRMEGIPGLNFLPKLHAQAVGRQYAKPGLLVEPPTHASTAILPGMVVNQ